MGVNESLSKELDLARRIRESALQQELQRIAMLINKLGNVCHEETLLHPL